MVDSFLKACNKVFSGRIVSWCSFSASIWNEIVYFNLCTLSWWHPSWQLAKDVGTQEKSHSANCLESGLQHVLSLHKNSPVHACRHLAFWYPLPHPTPGSVSSLTCMGFYLQMMICQKCKNMYIYTSTIAITSRQEHPIFQWLKGEFHTEYHSGLLEQC